MVISKMKKFTLPFIAVIITFITWWRLSTISLFGDSLIYFLHSYHDKYLSNFFIKLANFDWFALLLGKAQEMFFGTDWRFYGWTEVVVLIMCALLFYWAVLTITKKSIVAFCASLIVGTSYYGNWDMYAGGIYLVFLERVPTMLFLIPSFTLLHLFLEKKEKRYYLLSLILFFIGVGIGHWGAFITAPFVFYPFFWHWFNLKRMKLRGTLLYGSLFGVISLFYVIIQNLLHPGLVPDWSFSEFLLNPHRFDYPINMLRQLVYWSTYLPFVDVAKGGFISSPISLFVKPEVSLSYTPHVLIAYIVAFIAIYKKLPKFRALLITVVLSMVSIFFFNTYFDQYHIATQAGASRYLNLPTYLLAIFWSLFLWAVFWQYKKFKYVLGVLIMFLFILTNYWLVSENFKWTQEAHTKNKSIWNVAVAFGTILPKNSYVIIPYPQMGEYESEFLTDQFENKNITFIDSGQDWSNKIDRRQNIYVIKYVSECKCIEWEKLLDL